MVGTEGECPADAIGGMSVGMLMPAAAAASISGRIGASCESDCGPWRVTM
jgi:hypothetical protein